MTEKKIKIVIFSELTLSRSEILTAFGPNYSIHVEPPIKRNDIARFVRLGFHVALIIDGAFHQVPAVSCGELIDALRSGMLIVGAGSMGALRAAELHAHGMLGFGKIFEYILGQNGFADDQLGQVFVKTEKGILPLSQPYVDFLFGLRRLLAAKEISQSDFVKLDQIFYRLYYPERSFDRLTAEIEKLKTSKQAKVRLLRAIQKIQRRTSQKRLDAFEAIKKTKNYLAQNAATVDFFEKLTR